jgi:hypothetical protein
MPEDDPEMCVGDDAEVVTRYMMKAFYSAEARMRNNPSKIAFSRLTVDQYQNSVADLMRPFLGQGWQGDTHGLNAKYFPTRTAGKDLAFKRVDESIDFDFGGSTPDEEKLKDKEQFAIEWTSALVAPETGTYELILVTKNGPKLYFNGDRSTSPLIDNGVTSGETEHRAKVKLRAGRFYPLTVTFFRYKEDAASIRLDWVRPNRPREVISKHHLSTDWAPPTIMLNTEFPADDSSVGYFVPMDHLLNLGRRLKLCGMKKIAYLCSQVTIPSSTDRRVDSFEHDRTMDALRPEFQKRDMVVEEICWDQDDIDWGKYDAAIIGTTWDYWDRAELFLETLERIETKTRLFNSSAMVRWNSDKRYLKELAQNGAKLIPTQWIETPTESSVREAFDVLQCDDLVIKRQIGAGAAGQHRLQRGDAVPVLDQAMMAQPFFPSIQTEGEMSLIFIDGQFCHALIKRAVSGEYRIQSYYGGTELAIEASADDLASASSVLNSLEETPLYARVDMLRAETGELYLMELEVIEPYLYPLEGPEFGPRMAAAVERRLS